MSKIPDNVVCNIGNCYLFIESTFRVELNQIQQLVPGCPVLQLPLQKDMVLPWVLCPTY